MFTGIVQRVGRVTSTGSRLRVDFAFQDIELGESIAVNGVCLTVEGIAEGMEFFLTEETLGRTNLGRLQVGDPVNLERAMQVGDRLGGHFVQGHVDGLAEVVSLVPEGEGWRLRVRVGQPKFLADKGSITLDGISLTVIEPEGNEFEVAIAPFTWEQTTISQIKPGDQMNVEYDVLAKHIDRLLMHKT
ncbi:MAG: riboflavin synthase [Chthonomonas sp.]|nr:riboflavin synthase [Chthonomonas sp.]